MTPGVEDHELEPLAHAQIRDEWGDITYKLQEIQHVHTGIFKVKKDEESAEGELNARLYFVYFKLLH